MVTDIHDLSIDNTDQAHSVISVQQSQSASDKHIASEDHNHHCGVCSYDHGGHMGQTLATFTVVAESIPAQKVIISPLHSDFWYSRNTAPGLRPPIA